MTSPNNASRSPLTPIICVLALFSGAALLCAVNVEASWVTLALWLAGFAGFGIAAILAIKARRGN
ncbi:hypothetical protein [Corynebacterium pelargi]|uniref:Uncharacterized protein n=1 Tax=Corynebacterium pelargi TaxID=1471400 RepID=A0A410WB23_9CORY|nr:hypothetical protein [Corynebacterium pelargi]QAU53151.1 hypothetical protein CPELA_09480 [Corynebacterium pelargi]GGG74541.1 hypothetical protein GCM10007338_09870 [Corynebacterium pelargi]